jgi:hypothetical protein
MPRTAFSIKVNFTFDSENEKTRAIADYSTDSAGFTCPGFHLPRRDETYRIVLFNTDSSYNYFSANIMLIGGIQEIISGVPASLHRKPCNLQH